MSGRGDRERPMLFDPESPEYIKDLQRPAVIKEDLTEMERRKRVQQVLESKSFLKELENVIKTESEVVRSEPEQLKMQQRIAELTVPNRAVSINNIHNLGLPPMPIADFKPQERTPKQEKTLRNKLAALFRLVDMFHWVQGLNNHATVRLPGELEEILINPFGLLFHEISANSLMKLNLSGEIVDAGSSKLGINPNIFDLHAAIHQARPSAVCVLQLHTAVVAAVSSMQCGLLKLCHEAILIGDVNCHEYSGNLDDEEEIQAIVSSLGENHVLLLRNRGFIAVGDTVEEALFYAQNTVTACETQIRAAKAGITNLVVTNEEIAKKTYNKAKKSGSLIRSPAKEAPLQLKTGELEWEAWMRVLDHQGFRTGHIYRQPQLKPRNQMTQSMYITSDVALPPATSALGSLDESDVDSIIQHKLALLRREQEKSRWLNSPIAYQKVEILETNTDCPKRITKWVQDVTSPSANGTPVKIASAHQFSPMSVNPKEFKDKQKQIKENRLIGVTTAGPQSQVLEGVTYEDLSLLKPEHDGTLGPSDRSILIGTASKGIINRRHQHNAQVYRQLYAPNPFSVETDEDIKKYIQEVELKSPKSRTPTSSMRDHLVDTRAETASPMDDYPGADVASLMQGIRLHRNADASRTSASMDDLELGDTSVSIAINVDSGRDSTFDSPRACDRNFELDYSKPLATSTPKGEDNMKKQRRTDTIEILSSDHSARTCATFSEDEGIPADGKKKKKKGFFSFMRKKERSTAA